MPAEAKRRASSSTNPVPDSGPSQVGSVSNRCTLRRDSTVSASRALSDLWSKPSHSTMARRLRLSSPPKV